MKTGLFVDVDGVCTEESVNLQYARLLGIEKEQLALEESFNENKISTEQFGEELVKSFRTKGFTEEWAIKNFRKISLRAFTSDLFKIFKDDVYIVSSAPSYYIKPFAEQYSIADNRIMCSEYEFDGEGLISKCSHPVSAMMKGDFVKKLSKQYQIKVGIGDIPEQDSAFLVHCTIRILMDQFRAGYLSVSELEPVVGLLESLKICITDSELADVNPEKFASIIKSTEDLLSTSDYETNVFIMTPFREDARYREMIRIIKSRLKDHGFKGWLASDKTLSDQLWPNVQAFMLSCKYGIAVFAQEEEREGNHVEIKSSVFNPNVSIELGFMLSRGKKVLVLKDKALEKLPTDMVGSLYKDFDLDNPENSLPNTMGKWIGEALKK